MKHPLVEGGGVIMMTDYITLAGFISVGEDSHFYKW